MSVVVDKVIPLMDHPLPADQKPKGEQQPGKILPFKPIRQETVLSKRPIHNLSKTGNLSIHIVKNTPAGKTEFHWQVTPNPNYGVPRALAYKLDTIVINRRIDEEGRPLPEFLRLGSLYNLAKQLGFAPTRNTGDIKKALRQNAHTVIRAKFKYTDKEGTEHHEEFESTRYGVYFTGEKLPNGKKADAVFITLNPPYRRILNRATYRPLNYDYLNHLSQKSPAAARFYELISYRFYAFFKNNHPHAKQPYSEYCRDAPQKRNYHLWQVKRQMEPIHRRHIQSGYLAKVWYEKTTDDAGNPDWFMYYTPGEKARAEYTAFTEYMISAVTDIKLQ